MKDEETIVIDTDIRYKKITIRNITNFHAVKNTPKIIRVERKIYFPSTEMIQESISRMKRTMKEFNESIRSSIVNIASDTYAIDSMGENICNSFARVIEQMSSNILKIGNMSHEIKNREKFLNIAEKNALPIFFETGTPLQKKVLEIADSSNKDMLKSNLEEVMLNYYDDERIDNILYYWMKKNWIEEERKEILKESIEVYKLGYYAAATSTLMCQIGGVITRLYELVDIDPKVEQYEKEMLKGIYNISKDNSEKMKAVVMMDLQKSGLYIWCRCANYLVYFVYSSNKKMTHFEKDPGRNKICHGEQYNYRNKIFALKAILAMDMVIQLSDELIG